ISAKAQNPQNTNAWAMPGSGRSRITLPCSRTSQTNLRTRGAIGCSLKSASGFDRRTISATGPNRRQKAYTDADNKTTNATISADDGCGMIDQLRMYHSRVKWWKVSAFPPRGDLLANSCFRRRRIYRLSHV